MKFFSTIALSRALMRNVKKSMAVAAAAGERVESARESVDLLRAAPEFDRGADLLSGVAAIMAEIDKVTGVGQDPRVAERVAMGVDGLRMMSAYYLHAGREERCGDFGELAASKGADIQKRWALMRESVMEGSLGEAGGNRESGMLGLSGSFACLAVAALAVAPRLQAQRMAEEGRFGVQERDDLVSKSRQGHGDAARLARAEAEDTLSKMLARGAGPGEVEEASRGFGETAAGAKMNFASEVAQIQFLAGDRDAARQTLSSALGELPHEVLGAGAQELSRQLHWARGNDPEFCLWASGALGIGAPKMGGGKGAARSKP